MTTPKLLVVWPWNFNCEWRGEDKPIQHTAHRCHLYRETEKNSIRLFYSHITYIVHRQKSIRIQDLPKRRYMFIPLREPINSDIRVSVLPYCILRYPYFSLLHFFIIFYPIRSLSFVLHSSKNPFSRLSVPWMKWHKIQCTHVTCQLTSVINTNSKGRPCEAEPMGLTEKKRTKSMSLPPHAHGSSRFFTGRKLFRHLPTYKILSAKTEAAMPTEAQVHLDCFLTTRFGRRCYPGYTSVTTRRFCCMGKEQWQFFNS